ncbi:MAG: 16S rRNA (guanine(527)-N(7))-methyltransferase RsmG [Salinivirgaceae bacterium]|nr:16S rRNA (guanine(527)-N(7))-methyltransferase RsmG [Salinivirgaceae bacterium]
MQTESVDYILKYFPNISERQKRQFAHLPALYAEWNEKINVISRKDVDNLCVNHILHSLAIARLISFTPQTRVLDVGTGGGLPGIPLAIMFPDCRFHLVDSIGKKITVVKAVAEAVGLENVEAEQIRVEQIKDKYDFVVSRAVTRFDAFYNMTRKCVRSGGNNSLANGILYLKGGDFDEELKAISRKSDVYNISDFFDEPFFETKKIIHLPL